MQCQRLSHLQILRSNAFRIPVQKLTPGRPSTESFFERRLANRDWVSITIINVRAGIRAASWDEGEAQNQAGYQQGQQNPEDKPVLSESNGSKSNFLHVPWHGLVIWRVMLLWAFAYVIHPQWIIPLYLELILGTDRGQLGARGEAALHIFLDLGMLGFTLGILWLCLRKYKPRAIGWFRGHAWPPEWLTKVLLACLFAFPVAMFLADISTKIIPGTDSDMLSAVQLEQTLAQGDLVTKGLYFVGLTICAPLWEEVMFRGFLLPSLTRYMPLWTAVVLSALVFACVHFSGQRFLVLLLLGLVFGALYAESRNLMTAITAHSLWNMWVFLQFIVESRSGIPLSSCF